MSANTPQNYQTLGQAPLDAKMIFKNIEVFNNVREQNPAYAFNFYKGMKVYFQEEEKLYIWENPFSDHYKENEKLLEENFIYPVGSVYEDLDYSFKAYNLIELPYMIQNLGVWEDADDEFTVQVDIYEDSNVNPFVVQDILDLWPTAEHIAFIGGTMTGLKLSGQPIQLFEEFEVADWENLSYDIWNNTDGFTQNARIKVVMPGEIVDYTEYLNPVKGNSFKEALIIHDLSEITSKNSIYFKPVNIEGRDETFEIYVVDKNNIPRKLEATGGTPGEKGDKPAHQWNLYSLRFENPDGSWGNYVDLKGPAGHTPVKGVDYFDGDDGYSPQKNVDYFDGYTPVKGVDYFDGKDGELSFINFHVDDNMRLHMQIQPNTGLEFSVVNGRLIVNQI